MLVASTESALALFVDLAVIVITDLSDQCANACYLFVLFFQHFHFDSIVAV